MKSNGPEITVARQPREDELPELAVRMLSDFARIVAAEARLLESNVVGAAQIFLDQARVGSKLIVLESAGVVALLASLVLVLHQWMPWWQVLGLVGVAAIVVAEVLRRSLVGAPASQASRRPMEPHR